MATIDVDTDQVTPAFRVTNAPIENFQSDNKPNCIIMDEVNFKYLKHVIVKFLTSREVFTFEFNYTEY